jgi:hypothetical protein
MESILAASPRGEIRSAATDLVVVRPRIPEASSWLYHDAEATRIVLQAPSAVLVVRRPVEGEIRRVAVPVRRADLREDTLGEAAAWIDRLRGSGHVPDGPVHLSVIHVAASPDEMLADHARLREGIERLRRRGAPGVSASLVRCVRWGAPLRKRVSLWVARPEADLVVLRRHPVEGPTASIHSVWFDAVGAARCPVLLLPRRRGDEPSPPHETRSTTEPGTLPAA